MAQFFVSYSRADKQFVVELIPLLQLAYSSHIIWHDQQIPGGDKWWKNIQVQIVNSEIFVFLLSNDAFESEYCCGEFRLAKSHNKRILPVVVRPQTYIQKAPEDIREFLEETQRIDLSEGFRDYRNLTSLYGALNNLLSQVTFHSSTSIEINPFEKRLMTKFVQTWNKDKVADIYWLASDLSIAIGIAIGGTPSQVKHYLRHTYWHAVQLALGEPIENNFSQLHQTVKHFKEQDWRSPERRAEISQKFEMLLSDVSDIMRTEDKNFGNGEPPNNWMNF
jgi:hypothetical protein